MVAQVVVGDAGVGVDDLRGAVRVVGVDLGGDEHRRVAERPGVEDRRDLADDPAVEQALGALLEVVDVEARPPRRRAAKGSGSSGKFDCIRFISRLSVSSSGIAAPPLRERSFGIARGLTFGSRLRGLGLGQLSHSCCFLGVVGDDRVGTRAADRGQRLERRGPLVEPAVLSGGLEHRVLARDMVGGEGCAGGVLDPADHVEVGKRGLDHEHVGALVEVELRLADRLEHVGRIHLVAAAVARSAGSSRRRRGRGRRRRRRTWRCRR